MEGGNWLMSRWVSWMNGERSCHAPDWQNLPTLSRENDITTSGGFPARMAARTFSSFSPRPFVTSTVIHGYCWWNESIARCTVATSRSTLKGIQIEIVFGSCDALGLIVGGGLLLLPPPAVQAAASTTKERNPAANANLRFISVSSS